MLKTAQIEWQSIDLGKVLGAGGFGTVHKGTWQVSNLVYRQVWIRIVFFLHQRSRHRIWSDLT